MITISYNKREKVLPCSDVPVVKVDKFDVRQIMNDDGVVHSEVVPKDVDSILNLPFRNFSMQSYNETGEVTRLQFIKPKQISSFDAFDRVYGDLSEISAKIDHEMMIKEVVSSSSSSSDTFVSSDTTSSN